MVNGAVDLNACPTRKWKYRKWWCYCIPCKCGAKKHASVHGPILGEPPGSKPWGHEYEPNIKSGAENERRGERD